MAKKLIICAAEGRSQANHIVGRLIDGGFEGESISILFADKNGTGDSLAIKRRGVSTMAKASVGAMLGGAFVWLGGAGVLSIPNLGSLVIAGSPIAAVLGGLNRGSVAHALEVMGLSPDEARHYEARVGEGDVLISISVANDREATAAHRVVRAIGVQNVAETASAGSHSGAATMPEK